MGSSLCVLYLGFEGRNPEDRPCGCTFPCYWFYFMANIPKRVISNTRLHSVDPFPGIVEFVVWFGYVVWIPALTPWNFASFVNLEFGNCMFQEHIWFSAPPYNGPGKQDKRASCSRYNFPSFGIYRHGTAVLLSDLDCQKFCVWHLARGLCQGTRIRFQILWALLKSIRCSTCSISHLPT